MSLEEGAVEVGIVCTYRLLGFTRRGDVFLTQALRWVDGIIGALLARSRIRFTSIVYPSFPVGGLPMRMLLLFRIRVG